MNPDTTLNLAQAAMRRARTLHENDASLAKRATALADAARHYAELDDWIGRGGYLPAQWAGWHRAAVEPGIATTSRREGGCGSIRLDHAAPPYGPYCILVSNHPEDHEYPYPEDHEHVDGRCVPVKEEK